MTPQPRDNELAPSVAPSTAQSVKTVAPLAFTETVVATPTPANDTGDTTRPNILANRRRRRARLLAR